MVHCRCILPRSQIKTLPVCRQTLAHFLAETSLSQRFIMEQTPLDDRLAKLKHALELNEELVQKIEHARAQLLAVSDELDCTAVKSESEVIHNTTSNQRKKAVSLMPFTRPYFRDALGMSGPSLKEPYSLNPSFVHLLLSASTHPWSELEKDTILQGVRNQYLVVHNRDIIEQMDQLLAKDDKPVEKINQLNEQLALASGRNLEPDRWSQHIDWLVIAKQLPAERTAEDAELQYNNQLHRSIPREEWAPEEDKRLLEVIAQMGTSDWDAVADALKSGRLAWQCCSRYQSTFNPSLRKSGRIEGEEAKEIVRIIEAYSASGSINWHNVGALIEGRSLSQVQYYYQKRDNPTVVRKWLKLEDKVLLAGVKLFGNQWTKIATYLPLRNNRQLRERYKGQLEFNSQQKRKFGTWIAEEDEMIIEMSRRYQKIVNGEERIDFPHITKMYFPNRNVSQVYRRYRYLARFLPSSHLKAGAASPTPSDSGNPELMLKLGQVTRKRHRDRKSAFTLSSSLPDDPKELTELLLEGKRKLEKLLSKEKFDILMEAEGADEEEDGENDGLEEDEEDTENGDKVEERECDEESHSEYDHLFITLIRLSELRKAQNGVMFSVIDLNANELIKTAITEMIDPTVEENMSLKLLIDKQEGKQIAKKRRVLLENEHLDYTIASLDTMRYFLTFVSGCTLTSEPTGAILPPNASTSFAWPLLQSMSKGMLCGLVDEPENEVDQCRQSHIRSTQEYATLRAIFFAFFTWPAVASQLDFPQQHGNSEKTVVEDETVQAVQEAVVKRGRGRPKKRTFYFHSTGIDFCRVRARQVAVFATLLQVDLLQMLTQMDYYSQVLEGRYWPAEDAHELKLRVKLFLDAVWKSVDARFDAEERHHKSDRKKRPQVEECKKSKKVNAAPVNAQPRRRSSRRVNTDSP